MNTLDFLAACKARLGIESDYALAKRLGVAQSSVSNYRTGRSRIDDDVALTIADILGIDPIIVIAAANAERASSPERRARWEELMSGFRSLLPQAKPEGMERRRWPRTHFFAVAG
jgi:transcriptional regulator with XRE-family HTH domain